MSAGKVDPGPSTSEIEDDPVRYTDENLNREERDPEPTIQKKIGPAARLVISVQQPLFNGYAHHKKTITTTFTALLTIGYGAFLGLAIHYSLQGCTALFVFTGLGFIYAFKKVAWNKVKGVWFGRRWAGITQSPRGRKARAVLRWIFPIAVLLGIIIFVIIDKKDEPDQLISALGIIVFIIAGVVFSKNAAKIEWRMILMGLLIQSVLGLVILRWSHGNSALDWTGDQVIGFLGYADAGSRFVFGDKFLDHLMIMQVLTAIIFFGAIAEVMYYFGILQSMIRGLGSVMIVLMGVGPTESFVAAANIFLGPNNSALTVARFLGSMTLSELHCVMTSGFATVTGTLFGAYASFGVPASHLLAASFMSAPAAICSSKLFYPELEESTIKDVKKINFPKAEYHNPLHAMIGGAKEGAKVVAYVSVNLIGFVAGLAFFNATLEWFGDRVGVEGVTFQWLCSYLFVPLPFLMGIEAADCREVARLIGTKLFLTDIVAYIELGQLIKNRKDGLDGPTISPRSEVIATYALCGFANFPDVSICLGAIGAIAPGRKSDLARVAIRAMVAGNVACFITACVAGLVHG